MVLEEDQNKGGSIKLNTAIKVIAIYTGLNLSKGHQIVSQKNKIIKK